MRWSERKMVCMRSCVLCKWCPYRGVSNEEAEGDHELLSALLYRLPWLPRLAPEAPTYGCCAACMSAVRNKGMTGEERSDAPDD